MFCICKEIICQIAVRYSCITKSLKQGMDGNTSAAHPTTTSSQLQANRTTRVTQSPLSHSYQQFKPQTRWRAAATLTPDSYADIVLFSWGIDGHRLETGCKLTDQLHHITGCCSHVHHNGSTAPTKQRAPPVISSRPGEPQAVDAGNTPDSVQHDNLARPRVQINQPDGLPACLPTKQTSAEPALLCLCSAHAAAYFSAVHNSGNTHTLHKLFACNKLLQTILHDTSATQPTGHAATIHTQQRNHLLTTQHHDCSLSTEVHCPEAC